MDGYILPNGKIITKLGDGSILTPDGEIISRMGNGSYLLPDGKIISKIGGDKQDCDTEGDIAWLLNQTNKNRTKGF